MVFVARNMLELKLVGRQSINRNHRTSAYLAAKRHRKFLNLETDFVLQIVKRLSVAKIEQFVESYVKTAYRGNFAVYAYGASKVISANKVVSARRRKITNRSAFSHKQLVGGQAAQCEHRRAEVVDPVEIIDA